MTHSSQIAAIASTIAVSACAAGFVEGRAGNPPQPASFCDAEARGPTVTGIVALFGRGAAFTVPFRNSSSNACLPTRRSSAAIRASYWEQIGSGGILVEVAGLGLLNPDADQVPANVASFGEPVKRLAGQELLSDLALEFDAVRAVWP
jgi:hypothetical protein